MPIEILFRSAGPVHGDGDLEWYTIGFHLQYEINGAIVNVVILSSKEEGATSTLVEDHMIEKLELAGNHSPVEGEDDGDDFPSLDIMNKLDEVQEEVEEWATSICRPALLNVLEARKSSTAANNLHELLNPVIINLQLKTVDGVVSVIRHDTLPPWPATIDLGYPFGERMKLVKNSKFPVHLASDVKIVERLALPKVLIDGKIVRCKLNKGGPSVKREHEAYQKLAAASFENLRVPAFLGYVEENDGNVVGMLLQNINTNYPMLLEDMEGTQESPANGKHELPSLERRRKWASQIEETVHKLHEIHIIWGDVKPENVIVDVDDNAWIVDLGEGFTPPWKTPSERGTKAGDLNAVRLMARYLETGEFPEMPTQWDSGGKDTRNEGGDDGEDKYELEEQLDKHVDDNLVVQEQLSKKRKYSFVEEEDTG